MEYTARIGRLLLLGIGLLLATGCSEPSDTLPYAIEIREEQAGRIKPGTPFDASHIAALLPGFEVTPYTSFNAGVAHTVLHVSRHRKPIMSIAPTEDGEHIESVTVHTPDISAQRRINIGEPFGKIFRCTDPCTTTHDYGENKLLCKAPGSLRIFYLFSFEANASDTLSGHDAVNKEPVEAIIWKPDA